MMSGEPLDPWTSCFILIIYIYIAFYRFTTNQTVKMLTMLKYIYIDIYSRLERAPTMLSNPYFNT